MRPSEKTAATRLAPAAPRMKAVGARRHRPTYVASPPTAPSSLKYPSKRQTAYPRRAISSWERAMTVMLTERPVP